MAFLEDLTEFIDTEDGFADEATIDGNSIEGFLREEDTGDPTDVDGVRVIFVCVATGAPDIPAGPEGLPVVFNGTNYTTHKKGVRNGFAYYLLEDES